MFNANWRMEKKMDTKLKQAFLERWDKYFPDAELPLTFFYTDLIRHGEPVAPSEQWRCVFADLARARKGEVLSFETDSLGCAGAKRYFGFPTEVTPHFEYFLSCGIPGKVEGIRHKKSPQLVAETTKHQPLFDAPGKYIVFKRWDTLDESDHPLAVIFFALPDVLAGLFSLANFSEPDLYGVIAPSCSGCSSIVYFPYMESLKSHPRSTIGLFDISARPYVQKDMLTFAVPWTKFAEMIDDMEASFLTTGRWDVIRSRISRG
jgi:hypothetical protein